MQKRIAVLLVSLFTMFMLVIVSHDACSAECCPPKSQIVYSALVSPEEYTHDGGRYDLFLQTIPGNKTTRLTNHRANPKLKLGGAIREPLFSHDGKRVIFLADYSNSNELRTTMTGASPYPNTLLNVWEVTLDTRKVSPITKGDLGWYVYGWSPDDRFICTTYPSKAGMIDQDTPIPEDLYVWDMLTRKGHKLARVPDTIRDAFWSYDGKSILYQSWANANLYSVSRQGGKTKILLRGMTGRYGYSFSPDGRKVAYVDTNTVYVANANGSKSKPIVKMMRDEHSPYSPKPQWSRDGKKLAIVTYEPPDNAQVSTKLHVYDVSRGKDSIAATLKQFVGDPTWSRNGQWLIVKMSHSGNTEKPDPKTGWHTFHHDGLLAVSVADGDVVTLKEPNEETKGLDWFETVK